MHEAFEVSSLLKLTEQIESIAAYDDNLLLGTRQGHLLMYLVTQSTEGQKYKLQVLRYHKTFSKKPIQQIEVIPEYNLLLCLSDNILVVHDLHVINFPVIQSLPLTKGATLFSVDNTSTGSLTGEISIIKLCVAVKRKLQMYYLKNGEFKSLCADISVSDIPKVMMWGESVICVGFKEEYILYGFSGEVKERFLSSSSRSQEPCITRLSPTSFMLGRDQSSVIVDETNPSLLSKTVIKWNAPLIAAAWNYPYILGLLNDQIVVQTMIPNTFIQTLSELNKARLLCRCNDGLLYAASMSQVWRIGCVEIAKQRQMLLKDKQFELALTLTNNSDESEEEKKQIINSIQMLYAFDLFHNKKFSESMKIFFELETDPSEVISLIPELSGNGSSSPIDQMAPDLPDPDLESKHLALIEYLTDVRHKVQAITLENSSEIKFKTKQATLETIDTTLLKCYLQTNDAFVGPLLRLNNCKLNESEEVLIQYNKFFELTILYQTKGQHVKALQLLMDQSKRADSNLKGHHRTKVYLQQLGAEHINLIFKFSDWILREQPEEGLKVFTEDIQEVEKLPRPKVLDFLLREHEPLAIPYLEHIIHVWQEEGSIFHNALIRMLKEKVTDKKTGTYSDVQQQSMRAKLLAFLEKSNHYAPETVLVHFPTDTLFEERAAILGKLQSHEQALSIYVYILGDVDRAIRYCDTVSERNKDSEGYHDVYVILMKMLVNPEKEAVLKGPLGNVPKSPKTAQADIKTALEILERNVDKINPLKALPILPDSVAISSIKIFLQGSFHNLLINRRKSQVVKRLLYAEHLQVQELKMLHESQSVLIDTYNICSVCKKRFGNQSAIVRYPNGEIVHYSCHDKKQ